uniref:Uncharacterized protein n=1 Tax=mine drainage metagenome TaxID=410659 RepID=E6QTD6_9ZZZZ
MAYRTNVSYCLTFGSFFTEHFHPPLSSASRGGGNCVTSRRPLRVLSLLPHILSGSLPCLSNGIEYFPLIST